MWMLNVAGAIGLFAFFWASSIAPQSNSGKESPSLESTATTTSIIMPPAPLSDVFYGFPFETVEAREYHDSATPAPTAGDWNENPKVIGYSVSGRPIEVYRFGAGPTGRLIVAGIHGGNEWNTIKLANELIDYLKDHPKVIPVNICFRQIEFVGILKGARNRNLAEKWVDFMLSTTFQEDLDQMFVAPVNPQAKVDETFQKFNAVPSKTASLDPATISQNRERWIKEWTDTVLR